MQKQPNLLVVGSLAMDLIVQTKTFPASGETVLGNSFQTAPGGKGANQAVQAARLGAAVTMVGKVGTDDFGAALLASLQSCGVETTHVVRTNQASTAVSNIILESNEGKSTTNRIIAVPGANMTFTSQDIAHLEQTIKQYDMVLMQLEIPLETVERVAALAHQNGVSLMLNPAPAAPLSARLMSCLDYISPNEHEAFLLTGVNIRTQGNAPNMDDVKAAGRALLQQGAKNAIITLGSSGSAFVSDDQFVHIPCVDMGPVIDPTAAGDSFVGAFCTCVSQGQSPKKALEFATRVAGITVTRMGAQPSLPTMQEVLERA